MLVLQSRSAECGMISVQQLQVRLFVPGACGVSCDCLPSLAMCNLFSLLLQAPCVRTVGAMRLNDYAFLQKGGCIQKKIYVVGRPCIHGGRSVLFVK